MKITYCGHSAFIIENEKLRAIIDPFITQNPLTNYTLDEIGKLSHIFITHSHDDHLGDCIELAKKNDALVICTFEVANMLMDKGVRVHAMHIGGSFKFDFGKVKLTHAFHGGNPCGFLIKLDDGTIYHAGDTGLTVEMKLLEDENIDVAMLPIGGNFTMDIDDAVKAIKFIKPKVAIPMHYDTFDLIKANPLEFADKNKLSDTIILKIKETYEF